jgi:hemoglobin
MEDLGQMRTLTIAALAALSLAACHGKPAPSTPPPTEGTVAPAGKPLFDRLGGLEPIKLVVDDMVANIAADVRINTYFINADVPHLKQMLVEQICAATGGPCKYSGKDMKTSHTGMKIKDADFTALVEDLVKALDKYKVPAQEKGELLTALGGMKADIVGQ